MYEVGHNAGLEQSDSNPDYRDESFIIGYSHDDYKGLRMHFNRDKSWKLGWYSEIHISIYTTMTEDVTHNINLIGIADYSQRVKINILIQINSIHNSNNYDICFNPKSSVNSSIREGADKVLLTKKYEVYDSLDSNIKVELDNKDEYFLCNTQYRSNMRLWIENIKLSVSPAHDRVHIAKCTNIFFSENYN